MTEYLVIKESGEFQKGLLEQRGDFISVLFSLEPPPRQRKSYSGKGLTMKTVQGALKTGTATPEMLDVAIEGIQQREERTKQIDLDNIQFAIHKKFSQRIQDIVAS